MNQINSFFRQVGVFAIVIVILLLVVLVFPFKQIQWGKVELLPAQTVTVMGEAKTQQQNQIASFNAGVSTVNDNKEAAVAEVNQKTESIIVAVKTFGIAESDIKTENLSVYQQEEQYYEDGRQKSRPGQWRVNNSIIITLRTIDRASELTTLLTAGGATNVYGPNFALDDTKEAEVGLIGEAITNARQKAEAIALASGKKLGAVISVSEGAAQPGVVSYAMRDGAGGGGAPVEGGSGTVFKTVTVMFELR